MILPLAALSVLASTSLCQALVPYISPSGFSDDITAWLSPSSSDGQAPHSKQQILDNISVNGSLPGLVIAAQSWVHPDYAFHWTRDAALVYNCLVDIYAAMDDDNTEKATLEQLFTDYVSNSNFEQNDPTAIGGIGEPKFYLGNNSGYQGSWGRPQNDGPALRVSTLLKYQDVQDDEIPGLWNVVETDLNYLSEVWQNDNFDPWEEVNGTHFFNRFVQRKAFIDASNYISTTNSTLGQQYLQVAQDIQNTLSQFYDYNNNFIKVSLAVANNKVSNKDVQVILGFNHGYNASDAVFAPTDPYVLNTVYEIATSFIDVFPISNVTQDSSGFPLAPATGRYPEDVYDGYESNLGNPWFLSCSAFAEFFYNSATAFSIQDSVSINAISAPFWSYFAGIDTSSTTTITSQDLTDTVQKLIGWGDAFLRTVKYHGNGFSYSEQFNRDTGEEQGANELTWSHAAILTAGMARARAMGNSTFLSELASS